MRRLGLRHVLVRYLRSPLGAMKWWLWMTVLTQQKMRRNPRGRAKKTSSRKCALPDKDRDAGSVLKGGNVQLQELQQAVAAARRGQREEQEKQHDGRLRNVGWEGCVV